MVSNKSANRERIIITVLASVLALLIIGGSSLARVVKKGETENSISSGEVKVSLVNVSSDGEEMPELITGILPGDTLDNVVSVKNTGEHDEFVRIALDKVIYETAEEANVLDDSGATFLLNENDWTYYDGYYYYNNVLAAGETSEPLYNGIYLDKSMNNAYKLAVMDVEITVDAVQSVNNGTPLTAEGWTTVFGTTDIEEIVEIDTEIDFETDAGDIIEMEVDVS